MATSSGAFRAKAGHNQSGGAHYIIVTTLVPSQVYQFPAATGSGGAYSQALPVSEYLGASAEWGTNYAGAAGVGTLLQTGCIIRDMGKTIQVPVNSVGAAAGPYVGMRTFRKFQAVLNTALGEASFGVAGNAPVSTGGTTQTQTSSLAGYYTFYLEMAREAQDGSSTSVGSVTATATTAGTTALTLTAGIPTVAFPPGTVVTGTAMGNGSGTVNYIVSSSSTSSYTLAAACVSSTTGVSLTIGAGRPQIARYM